MENPDSYPTYTHVPFNLKQKQKLHSDFVGFFEVAGLSWFVVTRHFKRVFLIPFIWQGLIMLLTGTLICVAFSPILLHSQSSLSDGISQFVNSSPASLDTELAFRLKFKETVISGLLGEPVGNWSGDRIMTWFLEKTPGIVLAMLLITAAAYILLTLIKLKQIEILNAFNLAGIWKSPNLMYLVLWRALVFSLAFSSLNYSLTTLFSFFGQDFASGFSLAFSLFVTSWFGYYVYLLCIERLSLNESLGQAYGQVKPVFGRNMLRWLWFYLSIVGSNIILILLGVAILAVVGAILNALILEVRLAAMTLVGVIWVILVSFINQTAAVSFGYVSFYNVRHLGTKISELAVEHALQDMESDLAAKFKDKQIILGIM